MGTSNPPDKWIAYAGTWGGATPDFDREETVVHSGAYSVKFFPTATANTELRSLFIPWPGARPIDLGFWWQSPDAKNTQVSVIAYCYNAAEVLQGTLTLFDMVLDIDGAWEYCRGVDTPPATTTLIRIGLKRVTASKTAYVAFGSIAEAGDAAFSVYRSANQVNVATSPAWTVVQFNSVEYNDGSYFDTANYYWLAPANCIAHFDGLVIVDALDDADYVVCALFVSGVEEKRGQLSWVSVNASGGYAAVSADLKLSTGEQVDLRIQHNYGDVRTVLGNQAYCYFMGHVVRLL